MAKEDYTMAKKDKKEKKNKNAVVEKTVKVEETTTVTPAEDATATAQAPAQAQPAEMHPAQPGTPARRPSGRRAKPLQLTPIIQPIAFVPYSTQEQELYMWDDNADYAAPGGYGDPYYDNYNNQQTPAFGGNELSYNDPYATNYASNSYSSNSYAAPYYGEYDYGYQAAPEAPAKKKKGVSVAAILLMLLSLVAIALIVIGKFVNQSFLMMVGDVSGLDAIINAFKGLSSGFSVESVPALMIAVIAVSAVVILIASLIRIKHRGACVVAKIFAFLGLVAALVALIIGLMNKETVVLNIALYIVTGIMLLIVLIAFGAKNDPKVKKAKK